MIKALNDSIIFKFETEVAKGAFVDKTEAGIIIHRSHDLGAKDPRWGIVYAVGPKVEHVKVGDKILIEPLMWTEGFKYEDEKYWRTNEQKVMGIAES